MGEEKSWLPSSFRQGLAFVATLNRDIPILPAGEERNDTIIMRPFVLVNILLDTSVVDGNVISAITDEERQIQSTILQTRCSMNHCTRVAEATFTRSKVERLPAPNDVYAVDGQRKYTCVECWSSRMKK